jgi:hypothetical protein
MSHNEKSRWQVKEVWQTCLTPKIPCGFWTKLGSFGPNCKNHFFPKLNVRNEGSDYRILKLSYWTSTLKTFNPSFHEIYKIITIKDQSSFFGIIFYSEVLHSKFYEN